MRWGEPHVRSAGTTGEIEEAHKALDSFGIEGGSLANRTLILTKRIEKMQAELLELQDEIELRLGPEIVDVTPSLTRSGVECELSPDLLALAREEIQRLNGIPDHELIYGPEAARMLRNLPKEKDGQ